MCNAGKYVFKDINNLGYPYYHVHPYKQQAVKTLVERIPETVSQVIIFGSSVTTAHFWWNDLDVCIIGILGETAESRNRLKIKPRKFSLLFSAEGEIQQD